MGFEELGLSDELLRAISEKGYGTPTPIQEKAIPAVLMARDVLGCAQTGTGKTASFTLPMIDILAHGRSRARMPRSLILSPTRELAQQIAENFVMYGKYSDLDMALLIGGTSMREQEQAIDKGVDVLIATPGRLLDLYERGRIMLNDVKILVIDEADRMMDMGFIPDVETIVGALPFNRQTLFFSATMAPAIKKIADQFLSNPREITVSAPQSTATTVKHYLSVVGTRNKRRALRHFLEQEDVKNAFVFCNRKRDISILVDSLERHGHRAVALHGDLSQSQRTQSLDYFRQGKAKLLVCSDVAARGIDISDLSHVFNFDVPFNAEDYVHRIGRTGRAGKEGRAFTIATPGDDKLIEAVEQLIGKTIERVELEELAPSEDDTGEERRGGRGGRAGGRGARSDSRRGGRGERDGGSRRKDRGEKDGSEADKANKSSQRGEDKRGEDKRGQKSDGKDSDKDRKLSREERRRARSSHPADRDVQDMPSDPAEYYRDDDSDQVRKARSAFEAHVPAFFVGDDGWYVDVIKERVLPGQDQGGEPGDDDQSEASGKGDKRGAKKTSKRGDKKANKTEAQSGEQEKAASKSAKKHGGKTAKGEKAGRRRSRGSARSQSKRLMLRLRTIRYLRKKARQSVAAR